MKNWISITLIILLNSCQIEVGVENQNESIESERNAPNSTDALKVELFLTSENIVLWNGVQIDTTDLKDSLKNLIIRSMNSGHKHIELDSLGIINKTDYIIIIDKANNYSEEIYSRISDIIDSTVEIIREEQSQIIYHLSFTELSKEQQSNVNRVVEECVIETNHYKPK
jgi:hypothetical protein